MTKHSIVLEEQGEGRGSIYVAAHEFDARSEDGWRRNGPANLQNAINEFRRGMDRRSDLIEVKQADVWVTLDRLARAEESVEETRRKVLEGGDFDSPGSYARDALHREIMRTMDDAREYCEREAESAGMSWTEEGWKSITANMVIRLLLARGWIVDPDEVQALRDSEQFFAKEVGRLMTEGCTDDCV